eukprot:2030954-Pleurochrysis_carterae.AAC.1
MTAPRRPVLRACSAWRKSTPPRGTAGPAAADAPPPPFPPPCALACVPSPRPRAAPSVLRPPGRRAT